MAQFVHLAAVLSLCFLAVVVNAQDNGQSQNGQNDNSNVCIQYTNSGTILLDGPKVFEMILIEFGRHIQNLTPMVTQQWMAEVDDDHDNRLNIAECAKLIQRVSDSVRSPSQP